MYDFENWCIFYDFDDLKMSDMVKCGIDIRALGKHAGSMEEAAGEAVSYFFENFIDKQTGEKSCALVRLFKTHNVDELPRSLQDFANTLLQKKTGSKSYKCLTLLATAGIEEAWNDRRKSAGHLAIPLPGKEVINRIPMMCNLLKQMGLDVKTVINPDSGLMTDLSQKTFNVFCVPDARNSPCIPAQDDFVKPYGIKSVLGFGSILPSGNVFVVIIFSKTKIEHDTANLFNALALNVKMLIMPFEDNVFRDN
ncbi:MAG: hypothetical protein KAS17_00445 [Victivallaceae bacterium]|nr:hypothetical protein [Victivallaceae bacterium]